MRRHQKCLIQSLVSSHSGCIRTDDHQLVSAGAFSERLSWLVCLKLTDQEELQQRLARGPHLYRPLAERLRVLQRDVLYSQAQGIIRFDEDPELCSLWEAAAAGPGALLRAERYLDEFNRNLYGLEEERL